MKRQQIQFPAKDAPLRDDVHDLGGLVGEVVEDQCGAALLQTVEAVRRASLALYAADAVVSDVEPLRQRVSGRTPGEAQQLARAFSTWFQVVNLAEKVHRVRRRRVYLNGNEAQRDSLNSAVAELHGRGVTLEQIRAKAGWLGELCKQRGYRYAHRLQIELYGNQRGT